MLFRLLANAVVLVHALFIVFAVFGGFLALRWRRVALVHIPCALWGIVVEYRGWICPLTPLENMLRARAGEQGYSGGFIEHYLLPVMYPAGLTLRIQTGLATGVLAINVVAYVVLIRRLMRGA